MSTLQSNYSDPNWLSGLNTEQEEAVKFTDGAILVLAGAGTGKTRVLTTRIANLLHLGLAYPSQILAVTFTNKASKEMQERVANMIGDASGIWLGTFHSLSLRMLRQHYERLGLPSSFMVIDTDDQIRVIKQVLEEGNYSDKDYPPRVIAGRLDYWKNRAMLPEDVIDQGVEADIYKKYQEKLINMGVADFGDLLIYSIKLMQKHDDVRQTYQNKFRYILVDEYQDTNKAQEIWLRLLADGHKNICCVGDEDQSIYGWRGAEIENILNFSRIYDDAKIVRLERNYRSTTHIIGAASGIISNNKERLGKTLKSELGLGEKVRLVSLWDDRNEAEFVASEIYTGRSSGLELKSFAILVRAGHQTRAFEEAFVTKGMPYQVIGGLRFYERLEIRDAMAYLRLLVHKGNNLAFERIVNTPKRGIGDSSIEALRIAAYRHGISMLEAAETLSMDELGLKGKAFNSLRKLAEQFSRWSEMLGNTGHEHVAEIVLQESGYLDFWRNEKTPDAEGRVDNLMELIRALGEYDNLLQFLEHVSLVMDGDEQAGTDVVSIMTIHGAKGLEYDNVFLPGWEEGIFPSQRALDSGNASALEEERRLAYVAISRARKRLAISYTACRFMFGRATNNLPSRFIDELPKIHIEEINMMRGRNAANTSAQAQRNFVRNYEARESESPRYTAQKQFSGLNAPNPASSSSPSGLKVGGRVFHPQFGNGTVAKINGSHIMVLFDRGGAKTLLEDYLKKAVN